MTAKTVIISFWQNIVKGKTAETSSAFHFSTNQPQSAKILLQIYTWLSSFHNANINELEREQNRQLGSSQVHKNCHLGIASITLKVSRKAKVNRSKWLLVNTLTTYLNTSTIYLLAL